jgi:hypothetical protein
VSHVAAGFGRFAVDGALRPFGGGTEDLGRHATQRVEWASGAHA